MSDTFGTLLRRLRIAANLSQEALAEAARVSPGAIGAYERGLRSAPHRESVARLATALGVAGVAREEFENIARRRSRARSSLPDAVRPEPLGNLPLETTSFIGRTNETNEISELLRRHRVVTITGSGGIGKTRTALRVASLFRPLPQDGVWMVDFASISDADLVLAKIASVFGAPLTATRELSLQFTQHMRSRRLLVLLDSCEHVLDAVGTLVHLMVTACPGITILATSRERLRITPEAVYRLSTLAVPAAAPETAAKAQTFAAIQLFVERGAAVDHSFVLTERHVPAVTAICRRLEGIPLAIELAAARLPTFGVTALSERLADSFAALSGGPRDLPARQQTLFAMIDWSYSLLDEQERLLLQRLSIFRAGFTLSAVEFVCSDEKLASEFVSDYLSSLVDKCLVTVDQSTEAARSTLLESTRVFAHAKFEKGDSPTNTYRRFAQWWATIGDQAESAIFDMSASDWVNTYYPEFENFLQAVQWAAGPHGDSVLAARLVGTLPLWKHLRRFVLASVSSPHRALR